MLKSNDFYHPDTLCITNPIKDTTKNEDFWPRDQFNYVDPTGFRLSSVEQKYYKDNKLDLKAGHENEIKYSADHLFVDSTNPNEPEFSDNFHISHSYTQYRCNFKGPAREQILKYANDYNYHGAKILAQLRPKWGVKCQIYATCNNNIFEFLNIEYEFADLFVMNTALKILEDKLIDNFDWHSKADEMYSKKDEWELLNSFKQRQWKSNFLLGWETHYKTIPTLIVP